MKIMIVEDERSIREGLKSMEEWEQEGFEPPILCPGAVEALEVLERESVDVVITDLYMPVMNGLELIRLVREQNRMCEIIILTGHERFDLAQEAIALGVKRYLLKPLAKEQLLEALRDVRNELQEKMKLKDWAAIARKRIQEYLPVIRNQFWNDLLTGALTDLEEIRSRAGYAEIQMPEMELSCLAVRCRQEIRTHDPVTGEVALRQLTEEILKEKYIYALPYDGVQMVICKGRISRADVEILAESVRQNLNLQILLGVSNVEKGILQVRRLAAQAVDAVQSIHEGDGIFYICYRDIENKRETTVEYPYDTEREIIGLIRLQKMPERELLERMLEKVMPPRYSSEESKILLLQFLTALGRTANETGVDAVEEFREAESAVYKFRNIESRFLDMMRKLVDEKKKMSRRYAEILVQTAVKYMEENYTDPELSVGRVAENVGVTPNYLSRIFRNARGETCIDFLTRLRIERAKEMLRNSDEKNYVIAEEAGYRNPNYFNAIFRKYVGCTPKEYREGAADEAQV